jgi:hypothetical protein
LKPTSSPSYTSIQNQISSSLTLYDTHHHFLERKIDMQEDEDRTEPGALTEIEFPAKKLRHVIANAIRERKEKGIGLTIVTDEGMTTLPYKEQNAVDENMFKKEYYVLKRGTKRMVFAVDQGMKPVKYGWRIETGPYLYEDNAQLEMAAADLKDFNAMQSLVEPETISDLDKMILQAEKDTEEFLAKQKTEGETLGALGKFKETFQIQQDVSTWSGDVTPESLKSALDFPTWHHDPSVNKPIGQVTNVTKMDDGSIEAIIHVSPEHKENLESYKHVSLDGDVVERMARQATADILKANGATTADEIKYYVDPTLPEEVALELAAKYNVTGKPTGHDTGWIAAMTPEEFEDLKKKLIMGTIESDKPTGYDTGDPRTGKPSAESQIKAILDTKVIGGDLPEDLEGDFKKWVENPDADPAEIKALMTRVLKIEMKAELDKAKAEDEKENQEILYGTGSGEMISQLTEVSRFVKKDVLDELSDEEEAKIKKYVLDGMNRSFEQALMTGHLESVDGANAPIEVEFYLIKREWELGTEWATNMVKVGNSPLQGRDSWELVSGPWKAYEEAASHIPEKVAVIAPPKLTNHERVQMKRAAKLGISLEEYLSRCGKGG